jgi:hypothetical protein
VETTAADLMLSYQLKLSLNELSNHRADGFAFRAEIDIDAHLPESHERSHTNAANDDRMRAIAMEKVDGRGTATLLMGGIIEDAYVPNFAVFDVNESKHLTVAEMSRPHGFQSARIHGWNCYCLLHTLLSPVANFVC